jgi:hypothetical protein
VAVVVIQVHLLAQEEPVAVAQVQIAALALPVLLTLAVAVAAVVRVPMVLLVVQVLSSSKYPIQLPHSSLLVLPARCPQLLLDSTSTRSQQLLPQVKP